MQAKAIIDKARMPLADPDGTRWDNSRLLSLINDCLLDLAFNTDLFDAIGFIELVKDDPVYDMSSTIVRLNRVEYKGIPLKLVSYEEMDSSHWNDSSTSRYQENDSDTCYSRGFIDSDWQDTTGTVPSRIVYNHRKAGEFRIYPKLDGVDIQEEKFGIIDTIDYEDIQLIPADQFGTLQVADEYIKAYYTRLPTELLLSSDDDSVKLEEQEVDSVVSRPMISMIVNFVVGRCYMDNRDDRNLNLGRARLREYAINKAEFTAQHSEGNLASAVYETEYNPNG